MLAAVGSEAAHISGNKGIYHQLSVAPSFGFRKARFSFPIQLKLLRKGLAPGRADALRIHNPQSRRS
jgi:hypothetical protein